MKWDCPANLASVATACILLLALVALPYGHVWSADEVELTLLTGETRRANIRSIDADGVIHLANGIVSLEQLRRVERTTPKDVASRSNGIQVFLSGDEVIFAQTIQIADEICEIFGHGLGKVPIQIPIDLLREIHLKPDELPDALAKTIGSDRDEDRIVFRLEGAIESLTGLIESLDAKEVTFLWNDESRTLPAENLIAIGVASTGESTQPKCVVRFDCGASIAGEIHSLENEDLRIAVSDEIALSVDWSKVTAISIRSDRLQFLSDMDPQFFEHTPIVTTKRDWKRNLSVSGNELRFGDKVYSKGIGVASNSRLEYQLSDEFVTLFANIGIDAETGGRGDCVFLVRGDNQELFRREISAADEPHKLELDIRGVRKLELIVEAGADLDLADHANWCDACLLRD
ncbi:MAG: NPCBM/NEW2 domain-containing protein [Planctomycetota bacterium]